MRNSAGRRQTSVRCATQRLLFGGLANPRYNSRDHAPDQRSAAGRTHPAPTTTTPSPGRGDRLDDINTRWSLLRLAHASPGGQAGAARDALVLRYAAAIRGYVGAMLPDAQDADELAQEIVLKLLRGDFAGA